MKKILVGSLVILAFLQIGCKKFLDITPKDKLTGNNFYRSVEDIESNITDMYGQLFDKYTSTSFAGATGDFRSGEVVSSVQSGEARRGAGRIGGHTRQTPNPLGSTDKQVVPLTVVNDRLLLEAIDDSRSWAGYKFWSITVWDEYYKVIQSANLLISKIEEGIPALSEQESRHYIAEAKFIRSFCYFLMVRLYGDVVYYTAAYQKDPLPRENMVSVVNKCIADLKSSKDDLPMTISESVLKGVRASKGAVIGLLMNMNMWNAGFDPVNKMAYYEDTEALGQEIMSSNAFRLVELSDWATVVKGRSDESLFELFRTLNYNSNPDNPFEQANSYAPFGDGFIHFPYKVPELTHRYSFMVFTEEYMLKLYPDDGDGRLDAWFVAPFDQNAETFQLKKFAENTFADENNPTLDINPDNTYMVMRYADVILLRAEALAELGRDEKATEMLNLIRDRARAALFPNAAGDQDLKEAIFWERAKELLGEGTRYFDLVRTRRILDRKYTDNPLTLDKFERGGWTWPINSNALNNNPRMELNSYWIGTGL